MDRNMEWFIGGVLCLIIGIVFMVINQKISAGVIASFALFLFGVYKLIQGRK